MEGSDVRVSLPPEVTLDELKQMVEEHLVEQDVTAPQRTRRVNVNFSEQAYQTLEQLAKRTSRSMSDVLRDAIALKSWFEQTRAEGGHVLVERPDGKIREIISV